MPGRECIHFIICEFGFLPHKHMFIITLFDVNPQVSIIIAIADFGIGKMHVKVLK